MHFSPTLCRVEDSTHYLELERAIRTCEKHSPFVWCIPVMIIRWSYSSLFLFCYSQVAAVLDGLAKLKVKSPKNSIYANYF